MLAVDMDMTEGIAECFSPEITCWNWSVRWWSIVNSYQYGCDAMPPPQED